MTAADKVRAGKVRAGKVRAGKVKAGKAGASEAGPSGARIEVENLTLFFPLYHGVALARSAIARSSSK